MIYINNCYKIPIYLTNKIPEQYIIKNTIVPNINLFVLPLYILEKNMKNPNAIAVTKELIKVYITKKSKIKYLLSYTKISLKSVSP